MIKKRYHVDLPGQQAECEANYNRLQRILQNVVSWKLNETRQYLLGNSLVSESRILFSVIEQTKYTTLVHIVQDVPLKNQRLSDKTVTDDEGRAGIYNANVRLYHDVRLAEVVVCQPYRQFTSRYEYPNDDMHQVSEKMQINRFLGELLSHCLAYARVDYWVTVSG
ncbi:hypothetical protein AB835_07295 [Candidatus Endobugula sertula]|uniref:Cytoplasmic protein n=1 Tax=Candidatus Endobugula sertula TaxID=62101 RepID=A0A1D2QQC2_9GAMM|nr:hypothetical protein AB835_07295 [Candidatus Endobugula sertula]